MDPSEIHMGTLRLIRRITSDGELSIEEIWDLADYLNGNETAQHRWPGNRLWKQIERAFEDGEISEHEHRHLGDIIVEIEEACAGVSTGATHIERRLNLDRLTVTDLKLPIINQTLFLDPRADDEEKYALELRLHTCTCPDWFARHKGVPQGSFGRGCKHIIRALDNARENGEPITKQWDPRAARLINVLGGLSLGADPLGNWQHLAWEEGGCYVGWDNTDWASVFTKTADGTYERFGFNLEDDRWSYGEDPPGAEIIAGYLKHKA
jgi:hypothetical protein